MKHCSSCGQDSPANTNFCIRCGVSFPNFASTSFSGRPVISMDPQKQGKFPENAAKYSNKNLSQQNAQFQTSQTYQTANKAGKQQTKVVMSLVGALIALGTLFIVFGNRDSSAPSVTPSDQQSQSDFVPETTGSNSYYPSYDDYPYEFRSAFVGSCDSGGMYEQCICVLENLEAMYSVDEVLYLTDSGDTTYMDAAVQNCL